MKVINIWENLDYRKKLQLVIWSALPLFLACYTLSFQKTFKLIKTYNNNRLIVLQNNATKNSLSGYKSKLYAVELWKKKYLLDSSIMDANILSTLNISCDNLGLQFKEYKPLGTNAQNVWTRAVTIQGDFAAILKVIYQLEQVDQICRLASVNFKNVIRTDNEQYELACTIYIQNVINK